ncbi:MAG: GtrA family protein [Clostridia bacterium]|nr:GtrA family protein [Clostridia bacterium]
MLDKASIKKLVNQILKFGVVGGLAFVIDYSILILLTEVFEINYLVSSAISFTCSVIFNYILSIKWVFLSNHNHKKGTEFVVFIILSVLGLGLNELIMYVSVDLLTINYMIAKIGATAIVMVYNFITRKLFLEKKSKNAPKEVTEPDRNV